MKRVEASSWSAGKGTGKKGGGSTKYFLRILFTYTIVLGGVGGRKGTFFGTGSMCGRE
jgi:hypothetical protein